MFTIHHDICPQWFNKISLFFIAILEGRIFSSYWCLLVLVCLYLLFLSWEILKFHCLHTRPITRSPSHINQPGKNLQYTLLNLSRKEKSCLLYHSEVNFNLHSILSEHYGHSFPIIICNIKDTSKFKDNISIHIRFK